MRKSARMRAAYSRLRCEGGHALCWSFHNQGWFFVSERVLRLCRSADRVGKFADMFGTLAIITVAVVLVVAFSLRWQRDSLIVCICPREILILKSVEERHRVHGRGLNAFLRHRSTWIAFISYAVAITVLSLGTAGLTIAATRAGQWRATGVEVAAILCAVIPLFLIPLLYARYRKWMRVYLRQYLNDKGIAICRNCGYDLRGQVNPRCPECGAVFESKWEKTGKRCQEEL